MFYTNKENDNYLMIEKQDLYLILGMDINENLYNEVISMIRATKDYSRNHKNVYVEEIGVSKENIVAKFLSNNTTNIINYDLEVDISKIENALCISIYEKNPISNEIISLFRNQVCGNKNVLSKEYNEDVINYILSNDDFNYYVKNLKGKYNPKFYVIYENGECRERKLVETSGINLTKKR